MSVKTGGANIRSCANAIDKIEMVLHSLHDLSVFFHSQNGEDSKRLMAHCKQFKRSRMLSDVYCAGKRKFNIGGIVTTEYNFPETFWLKDYIFWALCYKVDLFQVWQQPSLQSIHCLLFKRHRSATEVLSAQNVASKETPSGAFLVSRRCWLWWWNLNSILEYDTIESFLYDVHLSPEMMFMDCTPFVFVVNKSCFVLSKYAAPCGFMLCPETCSMLMFYRIVQLVAFMGKIMQEINLLVFLCSHL